MEQGFGSTLCSRFSAKCIEPILQKYFPQLQGKYSIGLLGQGSEVLGFDDQTSQDHDWGPRALIFLETEEAVEQYGNALHEALAVELPPTFEGFSTHFSAPDWSDGGTQVAEKLDICPSSGVKKCHKINHRVKIHTFRSFSMEYTGFDLTAIEDFSDLMWLATPSQKLRTLVSVPLFVDGLQLSLPLQCIRAGYPPHIWYYLCAVHWGRMAQEEHLHGRSGMVGDEIGSPLIAARLVRDIMHLSFLVSRQYAPYPKWFGSAFGNLSIAKEIVELRFLGNPKKEENHQCRTPVKSIKLPSGQIQLLLPIESWEKGSTAGSDTAIVIVVQSSLSQLLKVALRAEGSWQQRQVALVASQLILSHHFNSSSLNPALVRTLPLEGAQFFDRPIHVYSGLQRIKETFLESMLTISRPLSSNNKTTFAPVMTPPCPDTFSVTAWLEAEMEHSRSTLSPVKHTAARDSQLYLLASIRLGGNVDALSDCTDVVENCKNAIGVVWAAHHGTR